MNELDILAPAEWRLLASIEGAWRTALGQAVTVPSSSLHLAEGLTLRGFLAKHGEGSRVRYSLTDPGREHLQAAEDELSAHDAIRELSAPQERPQRRAVVALAEPGELVLRVDFAVPAHASIGDRFPQWQDAVDAAQRTIKRHTYQGQTVRTDAPDYHPRRHFQTEAGLEVYTRAFVHMRVLTTASDSVARTWEVFFDGTAEALS